MSVFDPVSIVVPTELVEGCTSLAEVDERVERAFDVDIVRYNPLVPSAKMLFPEPVTWRRRDNGYQLRYVQKSHWLLPNKVRPLFMTLELASSEGKWELSGRVHEGLRVGRGLPEHIFNDGTRWAARAFFGLFLAYGLAQLVSGSGDAIRTAWILLLGTVGWLAFEKLVIPVFSVTSVDDSEAAIRSLRAAVENALSAPPGRPDINNDVDRPKKENNPTKVGQPHRG